MDENIQKIQKIITEQYDDNINKFANDVNVSHNVIPEWLSGDRKPSKNSLRKIIRGLGLPEGFFKIEMKKSKKDIIQLQKNEYDNLHQQIGALKNQLEMERSYKEMLMKTANELGAELKKIQGYVKGIHAQYDRIEERCDKIDARCSRVHDAVTTKK